MSSDQNQHPTKPRLIALVGGTASGKTALGIALAKRFGGEVICVDSRTVYRGMDIGTAKPSGKVEGRSLKSTDIKSLFWEQKRFVVEDVPHWGIDLVEPDQEYNISQFKPFAEKKIKEIVSRGRVPILVGGTGLWMDAIVDNLEIPKVKPDPELRAALEKKTLSALFSEYESLDPVGALVIDRFNPRRLVRAIEVCRTTGKPFSELRCKGEPKYNCLWLGVEVSREELFRRIEDRVDGMIVAGLVDEVRALKDRYGCDAPSMSGIGYRQMCRFLEGSQSLADAIADIKADTKNYAKRQMTWFRKNPRIRWITTGDSAMLEGKRFFS